MGNKDQITEAIESLTRTVESLAERNAKLRNALTEISQIDWSFRAVRIARDALKKDMPE